MRLVVTGGGTGGHLFPGLAVAEAVLDTISGAEVLFIGTPRAIDQQVFARTRIETAVLKSSGIKGMGVGDKLKSLLSQPKAVFQALNLLRRFKADLVFAVGGYVTGPVILAAKLLGKPVCSHEQNTVPGLANRLAGKLADRICISLPCGEHFPRQKVVQTGNPVRKEILALQDIPKDWSAPVNLLVLGGSQGAHKVNMVVVETAKILVAQGVAFSITHQTGQQDYDQVVRSYEELGVDATVQPFFSNMAEVYQRAHLAVSRAGATTLAELAVTGVPAVLIPYPYAADDHQQTNGEYYAAGGGCWVKKEKELEGRELAEILRSAALDPAAVLASRSARMKALAIPDATDAIVKVCRQLTGCGNSV